MGAAGRQMKGKKGQIYVKIAYEWPCMGSINDIQFYNWDIFSKIRECSCKKAFLKRGKLNIKGSGVKIQDWMSSMDDPCKLCTSCGQLEPKIL